MPSIGRIEKVRERLNSPEAAESVMPESTIGNVFITSGSRGKHFFVHQKTNNVAMFGRKYNKKKHKQNCIFHKINRDLLAK